MTTPAYNYLSYKNHKDMKGGSSSTSQIICKWSDRAAVRDSFIAGLDPRDSSLKVQSADYEDLDEGVADANPDKRAKILVQCVPIPVVEASDVNKPWQWRFQTGDMTFTVGGHVYWEDGTTVDSTNVHVLPVKSFTSGELVLFGSKSTFDLSTYDALKDTVNSDVFVGAPAGTLRYKSVRRSPRYDAKSGAMVSDLEVLLGYLAAGWNQFWREDTGEMATAYSDAEGHDTIYTPAAYGTALGTVA
jgi:hypothetical protein